MAKLKVFRTTIGFHDAYVAAPSRAAALRAWGAGTDLFAMGAAEEVTEPELTKKPLADPGAVIKRSRGTAEDHFAAVGKKAGSGPASSRAKPSKPNPLPRRDKLDAADKRLADAQAKLERAKQGLDEEAARLAGRRRALEHEHQTKIKGLKDARDEEEARHRDAVERWKAEDDS